MKSCLAISQCVVRGACCVAMGLKVGVMMVGVLVVQGASMYSREETDGFVNDGSDNAISRL